MIQNRLSVLSSSRVQQSKKNSFHSLTLESETNRLSKNVSNQLPTYNAIHPTKVKALKVLWSLYFTAFNIRQDYGYMCCVKELYCSSDITVYSLHYLQSTIRHVIDTNEQIISFFIPLRVT